MNIEDFYKEARASFEKSFLELRADVQEYPDQYKDLDISEWNDSLFAIETE